MSRTARTGHGSDTPFSSWLPWSSNVILDPSTSGGIAPDTSTSPGAARDQLRLCHPRRGEDLGFTIRAGLHTGEVEMADGDVHGIAVHIAARIMALAAPGEVLVSGAIPPLVLGSRITFDDRGSHELKGVSDRWPVLAVRDTRV